MAGVSRYDVFAAFHGVDKMTGPLANIQSSVAKTTQYVNVLHSKVSGVAAPIRRIAGVTTAALGIGLSTALYSGARAAVDFERNLIHATSKFGEGIRRNTREFLNIEKQIRGISKGKEFLGPETAQGLEELAQAGFDAKQSLSLLPLVMDAATAAHVGLKEASEIGVGTMGAFGLRTEDHIQQARNMNRVLNVMARTSVDTQTTMVDLSEAMSQVGATASVLGGDVETVAAMLGFLANAAREGSEAGTALKNIYVRLAAPESAATKILRRLRIPIKDEMNNFRDVLDILGDLDVALKKAGGRGGAVYATVTGKPALKKALGTAQIAEIYKELFGLRAITSAAILQIAGIQHIKRYREQLYGASGDMQRMASIVRDSMGAEIRILHGSLVDLGVTIFDLGKNKMSDLISRAVAWVDRINQVMQGNTRMFDGLVEAVSNVITRYAGAAWGVIKGLLVLNAVTKMATVVMGVFNAVTWAATGGTKALTWALGWLIGAQNLMWMRMFAGMLWGMVPPLIKVAFWVTVVAVAVVALYRAIKALPGLGKWVGDIGEISVKKMFDLGGVSEQFSMELDKIQREMDRLQQKQNAMDAGMAPEGWSGFAGGGGAYPGVTTTGERVAVTILNKEKESDPYRKERLDIFINAAKGLDVSSPGAGTSFGGLTLKTSGDF